MKSSQRLAFTSLLLLSSVTLADTALAADNCQNVKDGLTQEWGAVAYGLLGCYAPTPSVADQDASSACLALLGQGVLGAPSRREVTLWLSGPPSATIELPLHTYLGYCAGNKAGSTLDPEKAQKEKKELEATIKK